MALNLGSIFYQLGVDTSGLNKAGTRVKDFQTSSNQSFNSIDRAASRLKQTLGALISIEALRRSAVLADEYGLLQDRIKSVVGDVNTANMAFSRLEAISAKTGAALSTTAGGFQKLFFAKETVRGTNDEMIRLTQTFAELGLISGTNTQLLDAAMLQFSQGLVTGTFQAQEFQSVLENVPAIAPEIAAGMGITVQELIKMKKEGKLVSEDVFRALVNRADEISAKAAEMPVRLSRGFARFTLGIQQGLAGLDEANGLTLKLGRLFFEAGEQLQRLPFFVGALVETIKSIGSDRLSGLVRSIGLITSGMLGFSIAVKIASFALSLLTKRNVFFIMATAIGFVIDQTIGFQRALGLVGALLGALLNTAKTVFSTIISLVSNAATAMTQLATGQFQAARETGKNIVNILKTNAGDILDTVRDTKNNIESILNTDDYKLSDDKNNIFSGLLNFDPTELDIFKTFRENMRALETEHNQEMSALQANAAVESGRQAQKKAYALVKWEEWKNRTIQSFQLHASASQTDIAGRMFETQIQQAGQYSKEFAALTKALALFELIVKTPQAIGSAFTWGTSVGGPPVGAVMAGVAGAAMGVQIAAVAGQSFTPRAGGGDLFPQQNYLVGENGPELLNLGGRRGNLTPNSGLGGMTGVSPTPVTVNVYPVAGETATVTKTQSSQGLQIDVILEQVDAKLADGIRRGSSQVSSAMTNIFGLNRAAGAIV